MLKGWPTHYGNETTKPNPFLMYRKNIPQTQVRQGFNPMACEMCNTVDHQPANGNIPQIKILKSLINTGPNNQPHRDFYWEILNVDHRMGKKCGPLTLLWDTNDEN